MQPVPDRRLPLRRRDALWLAATTLPLLARAQADAVDALPVPQDLRAAIAAAAARGEPLVLLVTLAGCAYCEIVRRSYLRPLLGEGRVPVAQIDLRSRATLRGPKGESATEAELARRWSVKMTPTVLFLGPGGVELAPRLTGFSEDFYGAYLDDALLRARARLGGGRG
jgi:thioredoxin-related protein